MLNILLEAALTDGTDAFGICSAFSNLILNTPTKCVYYSYMAALSFMGHPLYGSVPISVLDQ